MKYETRSRFLKVLGWSAAGSIITAIVCASYVSPGVHKDYVTKTIKVIGDCTEPTSSDGYMFEGECRVILDDDVRWTLKRPLMVGDKIRLCRNYYVHWKTGERISTDPWHRCREWE